MYQFRVSAVNRVGEGSPSEPSNKIELPQEGEFVSFCTFFFFFVNQFLVLYVFCFYFKIIF